MRKLLILSLAITIISCSKKEEPKPNPDPGAGAPQEKLCTIKKMTSGSNVYTYTSDALGKVTEFIQTRGGETVARVTYEYRGDILYKANSYLGAELKRQFIYSKDANSATVSTFSPNDTGLIETERTVYLLTSGKLTEIRAYEVNNGIAILRNRRTIETDENGNIIKDVGGDGYTYTSYFDDKKNYLLTYPHATVIPTGKNNLILTELEIYGDGVESIDYHFTYNTEGLPISDSNGGTYEYSCK
jgi:hypothetical protein